MSFYSKEPFGEERADWRIALLGTAVLRAMGSKTVKPEHFLIASDEAKPVKQSVESMQAALLQAVGGRVGYAH